MIHGKPGVLTDHERYVKLHGRDLFDQKRFSRRVHQESIQRVAGLYLFVMANRDDNDRGFSLLAIEPEGRAWEIELDRRIWSSTLSEMNDERILFRQRSGDGESPDREWSIPWPSILDAMRE